VENFMRLFYHDNSQDKETLIAKITHFNEIPPEYVEPPIHDDDRNDVLPILIPIIVCVGFLFMFFLMYRQFTMWKEVQRAEQVDNVLLGPRLAGPEGYRVMEVTIYNEEVPDVMADKHGAS